MHESERLTRILRLVAALCAALAAIPVLAAPDVRASRVDLAAPDRPGDGPDLAVALAEAEPAVPELRYKDTKPPAGAWRRPAGKWITALGVALLAGGVTVAVMNDRLASDLESRYFDNQLTTSDASKYDRIDAYNLLSAALLAGGGAATGVGLYLWGTAPDAPGRGRAAVGIHGRF